jgi:hypothetical protein
MTLEEWFAEKRRDLFTRGCIYRYHIIDTYADEWNSLTDKYKCSFMTKGCPLCENSLDIMNISRVFNHCGIWWLIRFNS